MDKKVVGYMRVSTEGQVVEDKFGLAEQQDIIEDYCTRNNLNLLRIYEDEGIGGANLEKREGLQKLLQDAETDGFDEVIVAQLDRIARNLFLQLWIEKELLKNEVKIFSVSEPYGQDDPTVKMMRQMN